MEKAVLSRPFRNVLVSLREVLLRCRLRTAGALLLFWSRRDDRRHLMVSLREVLLRCRLRTADALLLFRQK